MIATIDLKAELAKLTMRDALTPDTTRTERKAAFSALAAFRDGNIFAAKFAGDTPWERHPNGDELVHIIDGGATLHILTSDGPQSLALSAGMAVVVPQGQWHRFESPNGVSLISATPLPTEHADADPRTLR
jgi:mannose-6-phosphate isomerase-like protein (cupin superfamily)